MPHHGGEGMIDSETFMPGATADEHSSPLFIAWQLNSECNLNCLHCCEEAGTEFPDALSRGERLDFCRQCVEAQVPYIALSGGEPMMCPDFWDICEFLRSHQVDVKVETNGEMIGPDEVRRFAQLKLRSVQISLDGATQQCHEALRENGDWKTVTRTIEDGGGDCEDLVILTLWIVRERFYIEGQMVIRTLHSTGALHATVLFDDEHYDPTTGAQIWPPENMIVMILDYDEVMQAVRWY